MHFRFQTQDCVANVASNVLRSQLRDHLDCESDASLSDEVGRGRGIRARSDGAYEWFGLAVLQVITNVRVGDIE